MRLRQGWLDAGGVLLQLLLLGGCKCRTPSSLLPEVSVRPYLFPVKQREMSSEVFSGLDQQEGGKSNNHSRKLLPMMLDPLCDVGSAAMTLEMLISYAECAGWGDRALWWPCAMPSTKCSRSRHEELCDERLCAGMVLPSLQQAVISSCPPLQALAALQRTVKPLVLYLVAMSPRLTTCCRLERLNTDPQLPRAW